MNNFTSYDRKEIPCPLGFTNTCRPDELYKCVAGPDINKCAIDSQSLYQNPSCSAYCRIPSLSKPQQSSSIAHNPPPYLNQAINPPKPVMNTNLPKYKQCPVDIKSLCDSSNPYQCLSGADINKCASYPMFWEKKDTCQSYCNIYDNGSSSNIIKKDRNILVTNNCKITIWIAILSESPAGQLNGVKLLPNTNVTIKVPSNWVGKIWGRTNCQFNGNGDIKCETGDCAGKINCDILGSAPLSLAEFILSPNPDVPDKYYVNYSNGINIPITIRPLTGRYQPVSDSLGKLNCGTAGCNNFDMLKCPLELSIVSRFGNRYCTSPCDAIENPQHTQYPHYLQNINPSQVCCANNSTCNAATWPSSSINQPYPDVFKSQCPNAVSWSGDLESATYYCSNADYHVTFC